MEGSTNGQVGGGMNPSGKMPSPPNGTVPSIFLAPGSSNNTLQQVPQQGSTDAGSSTKTSLYQNIEAQQRARSPPASVGGGAFDSYKTKSCASTQCGNSGYEPIPSNMSVGGCQQAPIQNRMYAPYMQQQQQIAVPLRSMQQHHHHGMPTPCHPHHPQQTPITVGPHLERMIHGGGSSAVAVAAAQQMRSMAMNHYQPNSSVYSHPSSGPSASAYYHQTVTTTSGGAPFVEYNHPHNPPPHHHQGHGISAAAAAAVQYAQQQQQHNQRMISSATATISPYRQLTVHHQQKVLNSSQAVTAYQTAYQQHQYSQYLHHHGLVAPSQSHPLPQHQNGPGAPSVMHQRMLGMPVPNLQQQQQQQAYMNRTSQHFPHLIPPQHNHGYSANCQPALISNYSGVSQQQQQPQNQQQQLVSSVIPTSTSSNATCNPNPSASTSAGECMDVNNNNSTISKPVCSLSKLVETKPILSTKKSESVNVNPKSQVGSSMKLSSIKLGTASPEKSVKLKTSRSVTKLRDRQPRLVVGQKKKSTGSISSGSSSRKLKSLKALVISGGVPTIDSLNSNSKRITNTNTVIESNDNGDAKQSNAVRNTEGNIAVRIVSVDASSEVNKRILRIESVNEADKRPSHNYLRDDQNGEEYVPTSEEMRKYLERLNTCNDLNLPLYFAYSVFHGKLAKKETNIHSCGSNSSGTVTPAAGTYTTATTTTTTSTTIFYQHYNQLRHSNFPTCYDWDLSVLSAEVDWINFQDDMAVLEAFFPLLSTMEQSDRAEKLDTIYTYEGQLKLMSSNNPATYSLGRHQISPPCNCVQDTSPCSCCFNYMTGMMSSPAECASMGEQIACRNAAFSGNSQSQYVLDPAFSHPSQYMSAPLSARKTYAEGPGFYDDDDGTGCLDKSVGARSSTGNRKRSSSYPSRKSGRRSSGSRDHRKSETESFLDELISSAKDEKNSKNRNNSGEITAPEIQCEIDFPTLESSAALSYSKRQARKKTELSLSARDEYLVASCTETEESESNTSACSSPPQSAHNTSSEGDFDGGTDLTTDNPGHARIRCSSSKATLPVLVSSSCGHFDHDSRPCCSRGHLWDDFRGDEVVAMPSDAFHSSPITGDPMTGLNDMVPHCTCRRVDNICPSRPPPGFEHLSRPAFPIELYDPSLLGSLLGGQLPHEVLSALDSSSMSRKQFEEMEELLLSLTCCEKHAVDNMLHSRRTSMSLSSEKDDESKEEPEDDWDSLEKAIKHVITAWTDELGFRKRMKDILFSLNLHDSYGGCCQNILSFDIPEHEKDFETKPNNEETVPIFQHESAP